MILGSDSHTRYGALGTMAMGEGGPELVKQLLNQTYDINMPGVVAVYLTGAPIPGVGPQDVALAIIGVVFANGYVKNKVMEFVGPGVASLSPDFRIGVDVMTTETTCLSSIWKTDDRIKEFYEIHERADEYKELAPANIAYYDGVIEIDLSTIRPMIAMPFHPSNTYTIEEVNANLKDAILNVFSMGGAMAFLVSSSMSLAEDINLEIHYETFIPGILFTLVVMVFFALLVTAVCMCTCVFAKNFKEANNYVTPVMLIFMFGSYAAMIPDLELTAQTATIPIVNVALLVEGLFQFQYNYGLFAIVLFSNVAYSLLAILILGKIYNSEAVLFSEGLSSVRIFTRRSEMKEKQMPGYGDLILLLCLVLLLIFYSGSFAQIKWGFGGVVIQQLIILLCPVLYAWYMKADAKKLFSIKKPGVSQVAGGVLFGIAAFLCAMIIGVLLVPFFPESADGLTQLDDMLTSQPAVVLILVVALMPAIGEELLFRGFVMGTLKNKCTGVIAVLVTTLLFAAYHMSLIKMFTIGIIGFGLTYAAYKSGSIVTSMCMHFLNNLLSVLITKYPKQMQHVLPVLFKESLSASDLLLMIAVILICAALGLLLLGCRKKKRTA